MIIYKRNIHVWRSMKHFQNANLQKGLQKLTFKYNDKLEYVFYTGVRCYDSRAVGFLTWPLIHLNQWRWHREIQYWGDQVVIQYQHKMAATLSFDCQPVFPFSPFKTNLSGNFTRWVVGGILFLSLSSRLLEVEVPGKLLFLLNPVGSFPDCKDEISLLWLFWALITPAINNALMIITMIEKNDIFIGVPDIICASSTIFRL